MREPIKHQLLSKPELDRLRSQIATKREAVFLAPQLLEQVSILSGELRAAISRLDAIDAAIADLDTAVESSASDGTRSITKSEQFLEALARLHALVDVE